ncbi:MAG: InlB B-repeat-containing protein [Anaerotignum sp.]|nr:InlB B-repeat-containing protein [Anaerotignum sp.]
MNYNTKVAKPTDPTRAEYNFSGWCSDETLATAFDFNSGIKGDTVVYAKWTKIEAPKYTVTFVDYEGNTISTSLVDESSGATAPATAEIPIREGYAFIGWDKIFDHVTANMTVTAQYQIRSYTVGFAVNGGSEVGNQTVVYNKKAVKPTNPTKGGFIFAGWYSNEELTTAFDFNTSIKDNKVLYAKWSSVTHTVSVTPNSSEGGTVSGSGTYEENESVTVTATANTDYCFVNWTESGVAVSTNASYTFQLGTGDRTLIANFKANPITHTVTFKDYDGKILKTESVESGKEATAPPNPSSAGYAFTGWNTTFSKVTSDLTVTAEYRKVSSGGSSGGGGSAVSTDTTKTYQAAVSGTDITPTNVSVIIDSNVVVRQSKLVLNMLAL